MRLFMQLLAACALMLLAAPAASPFEFEASVGRVIDGDTFVFQARLLNVTIEDTCRLLHYNSPELKGKEKAAGQKAKEQLRALLGAQTIKVKTTGRDKYGRWLCEAWAGDTYINEEMRHFLSDYKKRDIYNKLIIYTPVSLQ